MHTLGHGSLAKLDLSGKWVLVQFLFVERDDGKTL